LNRATRKSTTTPSENGCVGTVSFRDIEQMKRKAYISSDEEFCSSASAEKDGKKKVSEVAIARKEHMLALKEKWLKAKENDDGTFANNRDEEIRNQAQKKIDHNHDIAKLMRSYSEGTMAFTIRDQQLVDKRIIENQEKSYESNMNLAMEIERLRCMEVLETEEKKRIEKRVADLKVIEDQIEYRRQQKLLIEEAQEVENAQLRQAAQKHAEEQEKLDRLKDEIAKQNRTAFMKENELAIAAKKQRKLSEKEEEQRLLAHQLERDEAMRQREREEAEANYRKKELQKKMLESQQKQIHQKEAFDNIRARRAVEETERKYREKVLQEARRKQEELIMLNEGRQQLIEQKRLVQEQRKKEEMEEIICATMLANDMAKRERDEAEAKAAKNAQLLSGLQEQILERENRRRQEQLEKFADGRKTKEENAIELTKLETMRDHYLADLRSKGVQEKYLSEILSTNIRKLVMR
jgi:hypothetical protein